MSELKRNFPLKFKKNERIGVLEWCNAQGNFNDAIRYLIEKEVFENGVRNLEKIIPSFRDDTYFKELLSIKNIKASIPGTADPEHIKEIQKRPVFDDDIKPSDSNEAVNESAKEVVTDNEDIIIKSPGNVPDCYF